ncbi:MAG: peptidylprolyl isomerase [Nitrospinae bacterium]|nr:peptidylprolyl isomerase [Nitrospinota bacterium]
MSLWLFLTFFTPAYAQAQTPAAKVGDRIITLEELQKTIASTPYGLPDAQQAKPEDKLAMLQILTGMIDAELLYDEAVALKITQSASYLEDVRLYRNSLLADRYRQKLAAQAQSVDPEEVKKLAKEKSVSESAAKSVLVNERRKMLASSETNRLFGKFKVEYSPALAKTAIEKYKDTDKLVTSSAFTVTFRDVKNLLRDSGNTKNALLDILAQYVEQELFAAQAQEDKLGEQIIADMREYEKNLAVTILRGQLEQKFAPSKTDIKKYLKENDYLRHKPQTITALMIVSKTEEEANGIRQKLMAGGNFFEIASEQSIAPNANANAGRIDPISVGDRPYSSMDKALLALKPGEISKPLKGAKGYSLFKLVNVTPRELRNAGEMKEDARKTILNQRLADHIDTLRQSTKVEIYPFNH